MWKRKLKKISKAEKEYGEELNNRASEAEVETLRTELKNRFKFELPKEYADVLKIVNGLEFNGYILYGIDEELLEDTPENDIYGLLEMNSVWHEVEEQRVYLFLGESGTSWYVYHPETGEYIELDNPSGDVMEVYGSLDEMLDHMLEESLM